MHIFSHNMACGTEVTGAGVGESICLSSEARTRAAMKGLWVSVHLHTNVCGSDVRESHGSVDFDRQMGASVDQLNVVFFIHVCTSIVFVNLGVV